MLIVLIVQCEVRASRYPKTLGRLTGLGDQASTTRPCMYPRSHKMANADFKSVRESVPQVSWDDFLKRANKQPLLKKKRKCKKAKIER